MPASTQKRLVTLSLLLVAVTLAFYNPIVRNQFIAFDDSTYIVKNPHIQSGLHWETVKWAFTTFHAGNWHPLTWLSHALDYRIFRLSPVGHHYVNLLLQAANAVLLFLLLWRATGLTWPSLLAGALFALHPVNVESVAWAAERKNVLSMFFFLLALHAYDRYGRKTGTVPGNTRPGRYFYWLSVLFFALGLLAKPQIVTLPFVLLLWDYWPLARMRSPVFLVWEKWPFFVLAAADSAITMIAQRTGDAVRTAAEVSMRARLENVPVAYVRYLGKLLWPSRLAPMYPHPGDSLSAWQVAGASLLLVLLTALVLRFREERYLAVGWFWFLGTLIPMIGIVTVGEQAMADRYAYIPFIGLLVAIVWALRGLVVRYRIAAAWPAIAAVCVASIFGCLTYRQLGYWQNDEKLWRYTLSVTERNYMAHDNLALALAEQGRPDEAVAEFRAATLLHQYPPGQVVALALYELRVGHLVEAVEACESVLRSSHDPQILSVAWSERGQASLELRHYDQAAESFRNALQFNPRDPVALVGSGLLALREGQVDAAVAEFAHAVGVDASAANFLLLEQALRRARRFAEADSALAQARKVSPDLNAPRIAVGQILSFVGLAPL